MSANGSENTLPSEKIKGREFKKIGYTLFIAVSSDKMECHCSYVPSEKGAMMTRDEFLNYLKLEQVNFGIDEQTLDDFVANAADRVFQKDVLLAMGIPPVNGTDAYLKYLVTPSIEAHFTKDDAEQMDMRAVQTFVNVAPGENVARIFSHHPGSAGTNISGVPIPNVPGKALQIKIGKNLCIDEEAGLVVAEKAGRLCTNSREMSVEEVYSIRGDVDLNIGSVIHNGMVSISGDVLDGFNVTATKSITITGNVGACNISSKGDVSLCGMDGQQSGIILCSGNLQAKFLHDSYIECAGDVLVDAEVRNCVILCLGKIVVNRGEIAGGRYTALGGIEANKIGALNSPRTNLVAGVNYLDEEEKLRLNAAICSNQWELGTSTDQRRINSLRSMDAGLTVQFDEVCNRRYEQYNPKINVKKKIYENTLITIGEAKEQIREEINGPCTFIENTTEGGLRKINMTGLEVKAAEIEEGFIMEHKLRKSEEEDTSL